MRKIILALLFSVCLISQSSSEEVSQAQIMEEFGETIGEPIDSGFVFFDGCYIDAPYRVIRKGLAVYINNVMIRKPIPWPPRDLRVSQDPGVPKGLTENSSFEDLDDKNDPYNGYRARKWRYMHQHFSSEVAVKKMADYYASFPFVRSVTFEDSVTIIVETVKGEKRGIDVGPPSRDSWFLKPPKREDVLKEVQYVCTRFENRLAENDCFFLFSKGGELSFGKTKVCKDLGLIVTILRSKRSDDEKIILLKRLSVLPPEGEVFKPLVTNFQASAQLEQRIDAAVKKSGITPRTFDEIPLIPLHLEQRLSLIKDDKIRTKNSLEKEKDPEVREKLQRRLKFLEREEKEIREKYRKR
ncbi:MAG: hypothetical protein KAJ66_03350 [Candidatus Omnitrophica bacterium]|nr:hypothetical protein [Candidatus Omnitrophota bacterium]